MNLPAPSGVAPNPGKSNFFCDPLDRIGAKSSAFDLLLTVKKEIWWKLMKYVFLQNKNRFQSAPPARSSWLTTTWMFFPAERNLTCQILPHHMYIYMITYFFLSCKNVCPCRTSQLCISSNSLLANDFLLENWRGAFFNGNFRILKWRYCKYKTIFCADIPYIGLI